jgi:septum formation protein
MTIKKIVLASSSPRRHHLLESIGLHFIVDAEGLEEDRLVTGTDPHQEAARLSLNKARSVAARHPHAIVIAADTFGVLDGRYLGKPQNSRDAVRMLKSISGKCHKVISGFTIIDTSTNLIATRTIETQVYFRSLSLSEITTYVNTGEPLDKAGAYAIQGLGSVLVEKIEGDYYNVVGLPLCALAVALKEFDIEVLNSGALSQA